MLKELFEAMSTQAVAAENLQVLTTGETGLLRMVGRDGSMIVTPLNPPKRKLTIGKLSDLIELATTPLDPAWKNRAIFHDGSNVTLVLDCATGYETATLPLVQTAEIAFFRGRMTAPNIRVPDLVLAGQTTIRACRSEQDMADFVAGIGKLAATTSNKQEVASARGLDKLSRSVTDSVDGLDHLPGELQTFNVRPFATPDIGIRLPLTCVLLPRASDAMWFLQPLPESMLSFEAMAADYLRHELDSADVPVFAGRWT